MFLDGGVGPDAGSRRDGVLAGDLDADAGPVELQAVVHAAQVVAFEPPVRQGGEAMAAFVRQRGQAGGGAVEDDGLVDDRARDDLAQPELVVPGRDIPAIAHKHGLPPRSPIRVTPGAAPSEAPLTSID